MANPCRLYNNYREEHDHAISRVVSSGHYIGGEEVDSFSLELASYLGGDDNIVVPCANGSDALLIAYMAIGLKPGDEIIIPTHNYIASAESAIRLSLVPVWADTDPREEYRFGINTSSEYLDSIVSERTKAIVAVNMYGMPCDFESLQLYCKKKGLILIEDNAQGTGGSHVLLGEKKKMSTFGDIAITSFFPTKPLGCMGDGGALITNNKDWAERARIISQHGQNGKYNYREVGLNSRLDSIQAAILRVRLSIMDDIIYSYNVAADTYKKYIEELPLSLPIVPRGSVATFYQYTILLEENIDRDKIRNFLINNGISSQLYYPELLHQVDKYKPFCILRNESYILNAVDISNRMLSLPIYPFMRNEEIEYVCEKLRQALS